jgi:thymidylate kinase
MINTKLILVDGLPGSGKSTIAHFLARQMELNDIKVKWIYETIDDHPLEYHVKEFKLETFLDEFESAYPDHLQKFIDQILKRY